MDRAGKVVFGELALLPNVHQEEFVSSIEPCLDVVHGGFANPLASLVNDLEKTREMLHENPPFGGAILGRDILAKAQGEG
jgi:hypothetical protein